MIVISQLLIRLKGINIKQTRACTQPKSNLQVYKLKQVKGILSQDILAPHAG